MTSQPEIIVSSAHEVVLATPVTSGLYVCLRCRARGTLARMFSNDPQMRCTPHYELASSGWTHDERWPRVRLMGKNEKQGEAG
jgi:hypothetical protein